MNGVHLVTQEKKRVKTDRKWAECTAQGQPKRPGRARPAPACRAPSALPRACACAQLQLARARARPPAPVRLPPCAPQHASPARPSTPCAPRPLTPAYRAPGTPSTHARLAPAARSPPSHARPALASAQLHNTTYCSMISNLLHQIFFFFFIIHDKYFFFPYFQQYEKSLKITKIIFFSYSLIFK